MNDMGTNDYDDDDVNYDELKAAEQAWIKANNYREERPRCCGTCKYEDPVYEDDHCKLKREESKIGKHVYDYCYILNVCDRYEKKDKE